MELIGILRKKEHAIQIEQTDAHHFSVEIDGCLYEVDCREISPDLYSILHGDRSHEVRVVRNPKNDQIDTFFYREAFEVDIADPMKRLLENTAGGGRKGEATLEAPMPGLIQRVLVKEGVEVAEDQGLVVLVAMKMENELASPVAGMVKKVLVKPGDSVESGAPLVVLGE